ncbi:hypothetical protein VB713_06810 [Anabaena cylindrica UHCC 0172]|uniref:DUF6887 family protein n=1 Tax=Anabaena cylindrica TaxID=1165 RepID=UPI002B2011BD|nr:hypothetical protein [Anabaena cylindrica]MEA5550687.1 hypothetical protein [Anabaena cylindrica UHCC 0172]
MNQINYAAMSDQELKQLFIKNKHDKAALSAYLERRNQVERPIIAKVDDPDFEAKIQAAIHQQISQYQN